MRDKQQELSKETTTVVSMQQHYSGPLPPAQEFKAYGEVLPDAPERILSMAESEQKHRHKKEMRALNVRILTSVAGMIFGVVIVVLCVWFAYKLGMSGHDWLAGSIVAITTSCAMIFVLRRTPNKGQQEKE